MTTIQLNEGAEQKTRYGKNIIGKPVRTEGHCWIRVDTYVNSQGEEHRERRFCLGARDFSPMFIAAYADDPGNGRYHPNCSGCYLGHSHTLAEHEAHAVGEWR